jgi:hypothetical protein
MTNAERKLWLKLSEGISEKILASRPIPSSQLVKYWNLRRVDPMIQMKWEAETKVLAAPDGGIGIVQFPNGNTVKFNSVRIK